MAPKYDITLDMTLKSLSFLTSMLIFDLTFELAFDF